MAGITSNIQICNLSVSGLGNRNSVMSIDSPKSDKEIACSLWYDITRQLALKTLQPNFAMSRVIVSKKAVPAAYALDYAFAYEYPRNCLKVLGINGISQKDTTDYIVEGNSLYSNTDYGDGALLRIILDITDVTLMTPEFVMTLASELRKRVAPAITNDASKKKEAKEDAKEEGMNSTALNAQENPPIRKSVSRFRQSRQFNMPENNGKL